MSANPRKFSEKIALQQQKQAEGTAAYEQIMREVTATTRLAVVKPMQPKQDAEHHSNPNGMIIKDSDPGNSINLKNALMSLEDIKHSIEKPLTSYAPNLVSVMSHGSVMASHSRDQSPMRQHSKRKKFSAERHREFSPYASPHLLALDPGWRRVHSDSAIHAGVQSGGDYKGATKDSASVKEAKNMEGTANQATAFLMDRHLRPRSCEMAGLNMNGFSSAPQQVPPYNNTLGIPPQTNSSSSSLPNIKSSTQQAANLIHSMANYLEDVRCNQSMAGQPFAYVPMTVRSMDGSNNLVVHPGGGAIYLGNMPQQGSYMESLYGGPQMTTHVGSVPSQNGHFILHHPNHQVLPSSNLTTNQVIEYQGVDPPPYPYPKSSSLPPTSPPPSITLTDVECPGRPLETILMESPSIAESMYSPSWDRFLQSPGLKSPNFLYANPPQVRAPNQNQGVDSSTNSVYLMPDMSQSDMHLIRSDANFPAQMAMNTANGNQWTGNININNNNNNMKPQNVTNNIFRDSSVQILVKNEPPPPYESLASQGTLVDPTKNSGQMIGENLFLGSKRNALLRQNAEVTLPSDLEDFPSLSCLGDSFEDVELMNAGDLLEPLDIEDLNLLSSSTCTVPNEEYFSLDKNC